MTVINPFYLKLDGLTVATFSHQVESLTGLRTVPPRRRRPRYVSGRHGSTPSESPFDELRLPIDISLWPWDDDGDGDVSVFGLVGQLQANWDELVAVITKRGPVDVRQVIPVQDPDESGVEALELQADGLFDKTTMATASKSKWTLATSLVLPWPFWHELPKISRASSSNYSFTTGGTAPIANMVFTFSGDGTLTHSQTGHQIGIEGSSGPVTVDVRRRKVFQGNQLAMGLLRLDAPDYWMEWPAQSTVTLSSTVPVAVEYYNARF